MDVGVERPAKYKGQAGVLHIAVVHGRRFFALAHGYLGGRKSQSLLHLFWRELDDPAAVHAVHACLQNELFPSFPAAVGHLVVQVDQGLAVPPDIVRFLQFDHSGSHALHQKVVGLHQGACFGALHNFFQIHRAHSASRSFSTLTASTAWSA